jgi:hypothetical protein
VPAPGCEFDFELLLYEAVIREGENPDGDDTEGYPFDPITPSPASTPSAPIPGFWAPSLPPSPGPSNPANPTAPALPSFPPDPPVLTPHQTPLPSTPTPSAQAPKRTPGSADDIRRKRRGNQKRAMRRLEEKRAAPYGDYIVKPRIINKYIRPAIAIDVKFDALKLRHTKSAYTGGRLKSAARRVYSLDELVGGGSKFKFKLEKWDGRWVASFAKYFIQ